METRSSPTVILCQRPCCLVETTSPFSSLSCSFDAKPGQSRTKIEPRRAEPRWNRRANETETATGKNETTESARVQSKIGGARGETPAATGELNLTQHRSSGGDPSQVRTCRSDRERASAAGADRGPLEATKACFARSHAHNAKRATGMKPSGPLYVVSVRIGSRLNGQPITRTQPNDACCTRRTQLPEAEPHPSRSAAWR